MTTAGALVAGSGLPRHEAERLLVVASAAESIIPAFTEVAETAVVAFTRLVARRQEGEPLQYIEGTVQFGPLDLLCDTRALIPRPETEYMWELAIKDGSPGVVVDICTGSGCLALACKYFWSDASVHGADLSEDALALAGDNTLRTGLDVTWHRGDLYDALPDFLRGTVDLLISNPPYIATTDVASLPIDVRDHEPPLALIAGESGTEALERLAAGASDWLSGEGRLFIEIGETQAAVAMALFSEFSPTIHDDLTGRSRILEGRA